MVRFFRSLRFRLILLVMVALLPAVGVISYEGMRDRRGATAAAEDQLRHLVTMVAREQAQQTLAARHLLMSLAQAPAVRRQDAEACSALFARMISKPSLFINIGAIYPDGNIFASGVPMPGPLNISGWRYFKKAMETRDFAVGDLQFGLIVLKPVLIFSYPVLDTAGEVQTVLYATVSLDWLNHLAAQAQLPAGSVLTIIDEHGAIMARYPKPEKWAGKSLPPGGLIDLIRKHGQGKAEAQGMDGEPRLFAFMPLERDPQLGFVFAGIPTRVVYAAADQALRRNLAVLGGVLLLALALAYGLGYLFIMRRVNPLVQATARLAAGDLSARTGLTGGPEELAQLVQAFDHMAVSLEERDAERQEAEQEIQRNEARLASLLRISQYPAASNQELLNYALDETLTVTGSKIGYLYQYDEATEKLTLISYSQEVMKECSAPPKDLYMLVKTGIWGEAVRQRRPIMVNDFQAAHPLKKGYPQGHAELYNYLTIPVFTDHRIVGVVGIANKASDYDDSDVRQLTLMMESVWQIAERRRMEAALGESEALFQALFEQAAVGAAQMDTASGRFVRINRKFCDIVGYTREEMERLDFQTITHPDDLAADLANMERLKAGEIREFTMEKRYFRQDGALVWVSLTVSPLWAPGAPPDYHIAVVQDITGRKQAEAALQAASRNWQTTFDAIGDALVLLDRESRIVQSNRAFLDFLGKPAAEVTGRHCWEVVHGTQAPIPECPVVRMRQSRRRETLELALGDRWFLVSVDPILDEAGVVAGAVHILADITARKQAEAERDRMFNLSLDMMCIAGFDGFFKQINPAGEKLLGWTDQELLTKPWLDFVYPEDLAATIAAGEQLAAGEAVYAFENRYQCRDGSYRWVSWNSFPLLEEGLIFCVARDVTERKQAEEALRQSEERLRLKLDSILSPDVDIVDQDLSNILDLPAVQSLMEDFTKLTDMVTAILDLQGNVLVATGWQDICTQYHRIHPETARACTESDLFLAQHLKAGEYVAYECKNRLWDVVTPLIMGGKHVGNIYTGQFFYEDEAVDEQIFIDQAAKYGFDQEAYLSALRRAPRLSRERVKTLMDFLTKFSALVSKLSYSNLKLAKAMFDQQQSEAALRESEETLRTLINANPEGLFLMDPEGLVLAANDNLARRLGKSAPELVGSCIYDYIPPDLAASRKALVAQVAASGQPLRFDEQRGELFFDIRIHPILDADGRVRRLAVLGIDITERWQTEAALRESEELYRSLFDNMLNGFAYFKMLLEDNQPQDLIFLSVNSSFESLTGLKDVVGKKVSQVIPDMREADPELFEFFGRVALTGQPERLEIYVTSLEKWFAISAYSPAKEYFVTVFDVITARKQAEAELRESEALYRSLFDNMLNGFAYHKMLFEHDQPQDFIYLEVNSSFEALTGLTNVVGKKASEVIPGLHDSNPELFATYGRVALTGKPERFEAYVGAMQKWFAISAYSPAKEYFVTVFDDITERKQAEAALQQRFHDLAALYAASKAFLGQLGVAETLTAACRLAVEQFGFRLAWVGFTDPGKDYLVRPVAVYGYEEGYLKAIQVTWDDSPTGCGPGGVTIRTRQAMVINDTETDPAFVPWREAALARGYRSVAGLPMFYEQEVVGTLLLYSGDPGYFAPDRIQVFQSLANQAAVAFQKARLYEETQRYAAELEDRVAERTAQLESTNQELDRFAYSVSHDLRAPLRAMQGFSLALLEDYGGVLDPGGQDFARRIVAAAERMDHLIQDLLAYSRISREEMALQPVSLEQTVAEAMAHVEGDIQARQARVRVEPPLPEVQANRAALLQIVANLVSNAIKFTPPRR